MGYYLLLMDTLTRAHDESEYLISVTSMWSMLEMKIIYLEYIKDRDNPPTRRRKNKWIIITKNVGHNNILFNSQRKPQQYIAFPLPQRFCIRQFAPPNKFNHLFPFDIYSFIFHQLIFTPHPTPHHRFYLFLIKVSLYIYGSRTAP